jgi:hypothetical protein
VSVQVVVNLTDDQYRKLARVADRKQTNARRLIEGLVDRALNPPPRAEDPAHTLRKRTRSVVTEEHLTQIRELSALNWSDGEIGRRIGLSIDTVARHRNRLGIPARHKGGRPKKNTEQENPS